MNPVPITDPNWVNYCLWLIVSRKEREAREKRDEELAKFLRPQNETEP